MKTLIIYISTHRGNTKKIAKAMAEALGAELVELNEAGANELSKYDLIGFGSGIYFEKHHKNLLNFVDGLPRLKNKKAFVFSTRGLGFGKVCYKPLKKKLFKKGFDIAGEFSCRGFNTFGIFKLIGGISKGKPDEEDFKKTRIFARDLKKKICEPAEK